MINLPELSIMIYLSTVSFSLLVICYVIHSSKKREDVILYYTTLHCFNQSPRPARSTSQRPEGKGANIDRRFLPYHGKCKRIQSRIEFVYLFISIYVRYTVLFAMDAEVGDCNNKQKYKKLQDRKRFESDEINFEILQKLR